MRMKVLLSTVGSRGEVQPMLALAHELRALGHACVFCVAPTFTAWVESHGFSCFSMGPDVRPTASKATKRLTRKQAAAFVPHMVRDQFRVTPLAAEGCDAIVAGNMLQVAARSIAELRTIPYVYAAFCPATLPNSDHPPPILRRQHMPRWLVCATWKTYLRHAHRRFAEPINEQRRALGLAPIEDYAAHVCTDDPWVAADPALGPGKWTQTGAWLLEDAAPLPRDLEHFLETGEPPIYVGIGSMRSAPGANRAFVEAARAAGRRVVLSRGWAELERLDEEEDCILIGDVDHRRLFPRMAAIVHHGGAGTTTAAALSGRPQVIVPHMFDQYYWADRVRTLGIGVRGPISTRLTTDALSRAIRVCMAPNVSERAAAFASRVVTNGARVAAAKISRPS
jgi:vancomycin aglycone glucosyltransferase